MNAERIAHALNGRRSGRGWMACCVAHEDRSPSLSLTDGEGGRLLVKCFAGCDQAAVVGELRARGLWPERQEQAGQEWRPNSIPVHAALIDTYDYRDERGTLLYQILRYEWQEQGERKKGFPQRRPNGAGGWVWRKHPRQVLYRLPEVIEAPIVFVTEGEKDAEKLREHGFVATTNAGGAKAPWLDSFTEVLRGREVILIPDADAPGEERGRKIARALYGEVANVIYLELDDGCKDITDWFRAGHSELELIAHVESEAVSK